MSVVGLEEALGLYKEVYLKYKGPLNPLALFEVEKRGYMQFRLPGPWDLWYDNSIVEVAKMKEPGEDLTLCLVKREFNYSLEKAYTADVDVEGEDEGEYEYP